MNLLKKVLCLISCLLFTGQVLMAQSKPDLKVKTVNPNFKIYEVSLSSVKKDRLLKEENIKVDMEKENSDQKKMESYLERKKATKRKKILGRMLDNTPAIKL